RRRLHARIVPAIEALYPERLAEQVERLAHHAIRGELREKAVAYLRQAGLKAAARSALRDARTWFDEALSVLATLTESKSTLQAGFEIRLELRPVLDQLGESAVGLLQEAKDLAEKLGDERRAGRVEAFITTEYARRGKLDQALASGTRAVDIAGQLGDLRLRIVSASYLAHAHYYRGDYERAAELAYQNLPAWPSEWLSENLGYATRTSVTDRWTLVKSLATVGKYTEAMSHAAEGIQFAEKTQHAYSIGMAYAAGGYLNLLKGEWSKARTLLDHGIEVTTAANALILLTYTVGECAWALAQLNETTEALIRVRDCEERIQQQAQKGVVFTLPWAYHSVGRACLPLDPVHQ